MVNCTRAVQKLGDFIVKELYNTLSININPTYIKNITVTKLQQTSGNMKYAIQVKKRHVENESFDHPHYIKHSITQEYVDYSKPGQMEDVSFFGYESFSNVFYELNDMYHNIAQAVIDNDYSKVSDQDIQNILKNVKLRDAINIAIQTQNKLTSINTSINDFININQ